MADDFKVSIKIVNGVAGPSVYVADYRVSGPKPWGGGNVVHEFTAARADLLHALGLDNIERKVGHG